MLLEKGTDDLCEPTAESSEESDRVGLPDESSCDPGKVRAESCGDPGITPAESDSVPSAQADVSDGDPANLSFEFEQPFNFDFDFDFDELMTRTSRTR